MTNETFPTHDVVVTCDHDDAQTMGINDPASRGDYDSCCEFISKHEAPRDWEFAIRSLETGRLMSYYVELAPRRVRIGADRLYNPERT